MASHSKANNSSFELGFKARCPRRESKTERAERESRKKSKKTEQKTRLEDGNCNVLVEALVILATPHVVNAPGASGRESAVAGLEHLKRRLEELREHWPGLERNSKKCQHCWRW